MIKLPLQNKHFEKLYQEFNDFIQMQGYSTKGKKKVYFPSRIREFLFFLEQKDINRIQQVTALDIIAYQNYLKERPNQRLEGGLADSTINLQLQALRLFFDYLLDTEQVDSCPARLPKFNLNKSKERNIATVEEMQEIYASCETKKDRAIVSIAYGCGLRRDEIYQLNTVDVMLHKGMLLVRDGKGGKSRTVPMSNAVVQDLKDYLIYERQTYVRDTKSTPAFILNNYGNRMKGDKIGERLKQIIKLTNNHKLISKEITLHCLRHSIATHLLDNGATIEFVQGFLGHKDIDTSHRYSKRRKLKTNLLKQIG
jgi:integrase/recombinase XerD